jgi:hypothetical protein
MRAVVQYLAMGKMRLPPGGLCLFVVYLTSFSSDSDYVSSNEGAIVND